MNDEGQPPHAAADRTLDPPPPPSPRIEGWQAPAPSAPFEVSDSASTAIALGAMIPALVPVCLFLLLAVLSPGFYRPLLDGRASILGVRPIIPFLAALIALFAIDIVAARWLRNGCLLTFIVSLTTVAGMFLVILAPALLLIVASFREILP